MSDDNTVDTQVEDGGDQEPDFGAKVAAIFDARSANSLPPVEDEIPHQIEVEEDAPDPVSIPDGADSPAPAAEEDASAQTVPDAEPAMDASTGPAEDQPQDAPHGLVIDLGDGQTYEVTEDIARELLALGSWAQSLAPEVQERFAAVEAGAVPVSPAELEQFRAWQATREQNVPELDHLDDETAQYVRQLQAERDAYAQQQASQPDPRYVAQYTAQQDQAAAAFDHTAEVYAQEYGLSDAEMGQVYEQAVRSGVIANLAQSQRQYSPSGQLLRDADYGDVARQAFDFARLQNPSLRDRQATQQSSQDPVPGLPPTPGPGPDPTVAKKAAAGSLAAAPSAVAGNANPNSGAQSPADVVKAMADEIRQLQRSG